MITATEARELAGPGIEEHLAFIESKIRTSAETKKREVVIREEPYASWLYSSDRPASAKKVCDALEKNGFKVSLYYHEYQFVDMGLKIEW